jgi:quercetin dioxygenase-like cupin family protein
MKSLSAWFAVLGLAAAAVACGGHDDDTPSVADGVTETVRQLLADANPETAEGQLLELTRVIIPPGEGIPPHTHPGPQLAVVVSGTVTYTVIEGEATVTKAVATPDEVAQTYTSGDVVEIGGGDAVVEPTGMVHMATNEGDDPVIIYLSSLFPEGEPPASNVQ